MGQEAVIVAYGRSAVCKSRKGAFAHTHPVDYGAQVLRGGTGAGAGTGSG